jgi:hypothetical protein
VVEIWDKALSKRLQLDPDLTLESAKRRVRQREAVHSTSETNALLANPPVTSVTKKVILPQFTGLRKMLHL